MSELLLLRHAKSDWTAAYGRDHDRPLSKRGRKAARSVGLWMGERGLQPDYVACSSSVRTRATLERIAQFVDVDVERVEIDERVYLADLPTLLALLSEAPPSAERVLLIGHAPGMEELVVHLTGHALTPDARGKTYPTCALARLRIHGPWETLGAAEGELIELIRPRDLI